MDLFGGGERGCWRFVRTCCVRAWIIFWVMLSSAGTGSEGNDEEGGGEGEEGLQDMDPFGRRYGTQKGGGGWREERSLPRPVVGWTTGRARSSLSL